MATILYEKASQFPDNKTHGNKNYCQGEKQRREHRTQKEIPQAAGGTEEAGSVGRVLQTLDFPSNDLFSVFSAASGGVMIVYDICDCGGRESGAVHGRSRRCPTLFIVRKRHDLMSLVLPDQRAASMNLLRETNPPCKWPLVVITPAIALKLVENAPILSWPEDKSDRHPSAVGTNGAVPGTPKNAWIIASSLRYRFDVCWHSATDPSLVPIGAGALLRNVIGWWTIGANITQELGWSSKWKKNEHEVQ